MTKRAIILLCMAVFVAGVPVGSFAQQRLTVDKIIANVGNSVILYSDVVQAEQQLITQYREAGYTPPSDSFYAAFEQLLEVKLGYNQSLIDSLVVSLSNVNAMAGEMTDGMVAEAGSVRALEEKNNMPVYELRSMIAKRLEEQEHWQTMRSEVLRSVKITPGEVEAFFKTFPTDSLPIIPDQYTYAHITKYPPSMTEAKQRLRERMLQMRADLISGASRFEVLARLYSKDQASANRGGELPPFGKNEMVDGFYAAVSKLKPGQFSGVVETEYGMHLIELRGMDGDRYMARHILMTPEYTAEEIGAALNSLDSLARNIRQDSITFEGAAMRYSDDKATRMNGGMVTNLEQLASQTGGQVSAGMASFRFNREQFTGDLYADYQKLIAMSKGDVSDAYQSRDLRGNTQAKIIKLLEFYPTHEANLADDYLVIEDSARNNKMEKVYAEWLEKTIEATYIRIDPAYRDGLDPKWVK
jgi:peptidyl-prolyl cis-trans isomerase SurA